MLFATNGAKIYIGTAMDLPSGDLAEADFASQSDNWVEIGEMVNLGTLAQQANQIKQPVIGRERSVSLKGTREGQAVSLVFGLDYSDAGQQALLAAEKAKDNYAFRLVFNDAPAAGSAPAPSERKWAAVVGTFGEVFNEADNVMQGQADLWVNSNFVRTPATAGA